MAKPKGPTAEPEWLTVAEAAEYLRVSRDTLYRWARQGKLPLYKVGERATRIRKRDLDALVHPKPPTGAGARPGDPWTRLSEGAFADWDNPEDAIYDDWQQLYGVSEG